ncbi:hypothetical protein [Streptomyces lavendulae]|uniref:hypothetical protein n=1 Tax=Streptomyces lavendulae TaxID=1914 RepID=UPI0036E81EC2
MGAGNYLDRCVGAPSAWLSFDPGFEEYFTGGAARALLRSRFEDPGFDLADEAFSAMVALMIAASSADPGEQRLVDLLAAQVKACRWGARFRFFPGASTFPTDTDCTALATAALFEHGLMSTADLGRVIQELLRAAAPVESGRDGEDSSAGRVLTVYWGDGAEPGTQSHGRRHDPVACANALYTVHLNRGQISGGVEAVIEASMRYLRDHLTSRRYLLGTRYYPSPEALVYAVSRICARFPEHSKMLRTPLHRAFGEREAEAPVRALVGRPGTALDIALRALAAENCGWEEGQRERRRLLASLQRQDGSWPACPYYRMGRFPLYFGSPYLTTLFARRALRGRHGQES